MFFTLTPPSSSALSTIPIRIFSVQDIKEYRELPLVNNLTMTKIFNIHRKDIVYNQISNIANDIM